MITFSRAAINFSILRHRSHRHPNMLGKLIAGHGPDDDALAEQSIEYFLPFADAHQDEIGACRHELQSESGEFFLQIIDSLAVHRQAAAHMLAHRRAPPKPPTAPAR